MWCRMKTAERITASGDIHLRVCAAPGHDSLNGELPLGVDKTVVQDKAPARNVESDQPTTPIMLV